MRERVCAAILRDGAILMVRIDYGDRVNLTLPGGGVDAGETHEEALVREVAEEANVVGRVIRAPVHAAGRARVGGRAGNVLPGRDRS